MGEFIQNAGFPIYAVMTLGLAAVFMGLKDVLEPRRGRTALTHGLVTATVFMGALGTVVGLQVSIHAAMDLPLDRQFLAAVGLAEALNNAVAALTLGVVARLLSAVAEKKRVDHGSATPLV